MFETFWNIKKMIEITNKEKLKEGEEENEEDDAGNNEVEDDKKGIN